MNDEAVYRTAPATPGLLIIGSVSSYRAPVWHLITEQRHLAKGSLSTLHCIEEKGKTKLQQFSSCCERRAFS